MMRIGEKLTIAVLLLLTSGQNVWGISSEDKCEADKNKIAGKYAFCRQNAEAKAIKKGEAPDYAKCDEKYAEKWQKVESKAGPGICPSDGDEVTIQAFITQQADDLASALSGGGLPNCNGDLATCQTDLTTCGGDLTSCVADLTICDGDLTTCSADLTQAQSDLAVCQGDLGTCNSDLGSCETDLTNCLAAPAGQRIQTGQTTCYNAAGSVIACAGTGQDGELQTGLPASFTDNGDGTITDSNTGLVWERLSDDGSIHDKDNTFTWADAFASKVAALNTAAFAGYTDWRVPNVNELQSIVSFVAVNPSVNAVFNTACVADCTVLDCSCTGSGQYWTSTTYNILYWAWYVQFTAGQTGSAQKTSGKSVRAVRGGS
jgi:hypothetical protein